MKRLMLVLCLVVSSAYGGWSSNFTTSQKKAKADDKLMLVNFTGKKWCSYCIKQEKNIFKKTAFKNFAKAHLVLVELDFPSGRKPKKSLQELKKKFKVSGFPTVIVLDPEGTEVARYGGYNSSLTVEKYVERLEKLVNAYKTKAEDAAEKGKKKGSKKRK